MCAASLRVYLAIDIDVAEIKLVEGGDISYNVMRRLVRSNEYLVP